jgi:excisionase family DNA binding protein
MSRRAYRIEEAAEQIGVSAKTLRREIRDGKLRARRLRGVTVIFTGDLDRYLAGLPDEAGAVVNVAASTTRRVQPERSRGRVTHLFDISEGVGAS